ncbi:hypothetical protein CES85_3315 (plasmid) [Ochrobactrum quorumnocens]|uniref:Uncharacterized protein n=1 Tax=Ochrobactrum quorumnocens TaxID=271865 RepID=A0A248UQM6_9HYPH|nr:hypothetical protein CES85_3315 [[Ochrobactrum] quorumnocens]
MRCKLIDELPIDRLSTYECAEPDGRHKTLECVISSLGHWNFGPFDRAIYHDFGIRKPFPPYLRNYTFYSLVSIE